VFCILLKDVVQCGGDSFRFLLYVALWAYIIPLPRYKFWRVVSHL